MKNESSKQIFKSTSLIGGSQIINIIIGIFRTKVVALLLGPTGIGIIGIVQSMVDLIRNASGFGINFSGVKNIAEASKDQDLDKISYMATVLKWWAVGTGLLGAVLTILLCVPLSLYSFGDNSYVLGIASLSIVIFLTAISAAQITLLQGLRRIRQMAEATLIGSLLGTIITLPLYWWLGNKGIIPAMILISLSSFFVSWVYTKNIKLNKPRVSIREVFFAGLGMAKLGFFIVINGFVAAGSLYLLRIIIMSNGGLEYVGLFQAIWAISTFYVSILLNSMLADYFPRLSIIHGDINERNKLMNEQIEIVLLIGTPMLLGMLIFAYPIINLLYSSSFIVAVPIFRWHILSSFLTLIAWPLGVVFLANNKGEYSILAESLKQLVFISFVYFGWKFWGSTVLGIGYFLAMCINLAIILYFVLYLWGFRYTIINIKYILFFSLVISIVFLNINISDHIILLIVNIAILISLSAFCLVRLNKLIDIKSLVLSRLIK